MEFPTSLPGMVPGAPGRNRLLGSVFLLSVFGLVLVLAVLRASYHPVRGC